jgi:phage shock protein B
MSEILGILFLTIVVPIWLVTHYVTKWKMAKGLSAQDEELLEDLWNSAKSMEGRVATLETILEKSPEMGRSR